VASLKELKARINSVKSTQKITKAKQMVAAAKLRKAQVAAESARPYAMRLASVVASLASKTSAQQAAPRLLVGTGSDQKHLLVVANSDKGLAGAFNSNIVRSALAKAAELKAKGKTVQFYLIGRKGRAAIQRAWPKAIIGQYDTTAMREPNYDDAANIANALRDIYYSGDFDVAHIFYSRFKSALVQTATHMQIVPIQGPAQGVPDNAAVEYEPDEESILAELLPRYLRTLVLHALLENSASEQGASMTAMDNATRNAGELINKLTIQYNRSRQAAITTELIEIIAGAEAL
jgi:F-type H+-transporting ATPase subunit gamma